MRFEEELLHHLEAGRTQEAIAILKEETAKYRAMVRKHSVQILEKTMYQVKCHYCGSTTQLLDTREEAERLQSGHSDAQCDRNLAMNGGTATPVGPI
jgi:hypothetical protein